MPRLKLLELHGYKTFASKTRFEFAEGITAIVGPNGSGKSNIADSLRWVLGEQAYGLLRGKKTEDMIFSGSEQRPRAGMASALITFDNADGGLPIEFSEVSIGRTAYRDGSNEYFLNDQKVRLKDIDELLARCGLSERTYTIIGQGLVDSALSLKPEERRRLFEEAAGIGLYRSRREESLRRLETTKRNLERVLDILTELQPRVESLRRQAKRAGEFETVRSELKDVLRQWHGYHWRVAQEEVTRAATMADAANEILGGLRETQDKSDTRFLEIRGILTALRAQLNSWHRQASELHRTREEISRQLAVSEERLRLLERSREEAAAALTVAEAEQAKFSERAAALAQDRERVKSELADIRAQLARAQAAREEEETQRREKAARIEERRLAVQEMEAALARLDARAGQFAERTADLDRRDAALREAAGKLSAEAEAHNLASVESDKAWDDEKRQLAEVLERQAELEKSLSDGQAELERRRDALAKKREEEYRLRARIDVLEQAEKELLGYGAGLRHLIGRAQQGELPGVLGAFGSQVEVRAEYEAAVSAALGEFQDSILLQEADSLDRALDELAAGSAGRAGLLPLPGLVPPEPAARPQGDDVIGWASALVKAPAALRPAVEALLGNVLVVTDRTAARRLIGEMPTHTRLATLSGEVFHPAGPVLAGRGEGASSLSRVREIRELEAQLLSAQENTARAESQVSSAELAVLESQRLIEENTKQAAERREAEQAAARRAEEKQRAKTAKEEELRWQEARRAELEAERRETAADAARLAGETAELGARLEAARAELGAAERGGKGAPEGEAVYDLPHWQTSFALAEQAEREIGARTADAEESLARGNRSVAERQDRIRALEGEQTQLEAALHSLRGEESRLSASIHETQTQIEPAEKQLAEAEKEQADLEGEEAESRMRLHSAENQYTQAQVDLARRQEELEGLRRRIEDDFGLVEFEYASEVTGPNPLPLSELVEHLPYVEAVTPEIEEVVNRRRSQLRRMGAINPEAVREFAEVKERFEFLTGQVKDLQQAETQLREVIAELDTMMREAFQKTFQAVSEEFPRIFVRLFGGGSARLVLTEGEDAGDSGIDITARLPGRRSQGLALLSGGERSLTAVALVFSLLKVSPTPFCVLDEVDAMLDESNVGRFRDLLAELSQQTQFVVVTHNRNTVQAAQVIYGISMGSDSASQVISLKLDEFVGK